MLVPHIIFFYIVEFTGPYTNTLQVSLNTFRGYLREYLWPMVLTRKYLTTPSPTTTTTSLTTLTSTELEWYNETTFNKTTHMFKTYQMYDCNNKPFAQSRISCYWSSRMQGLCHGYKQENRETRFYCPRECGVCPPIHVISTHDNLHTHTRKKNSLGERPEVDPKFPILVSQDYH